MKVSVVILNFNGSRFLRDLFESLANQTFQDFEVVFIDNKSTDNSLQMLNEMLPTGIMENLRVRIIENNHNIGYCKGNNLAMEYSKGDYIIFLNNDTYVSEKWLEELVSVMDKYPSLGACQSRHIQAQTSIIQTDGWSLDEYGWTQKLIIRRSSLEISRELFYTSGASMIARKDDLLRVGGFDPELFYGDFDLCWRLRLLGYEIAAALLSICYHYGRYATKMTISPIKEVYIHDREMLRVLLKNYSTQNVIRKVPLSICIMIVEATYLSLRFKTPLYLANFLKALTWNLTNLKDTLLARYRVQKSREVSDRKIKRKMVCYSVLLARRMTVEIA